MKRLSLYLLGFLFIGLVACSEGEGGEEESSEEETTEESAE